VDEETYENYIQINLITTLNFIINLPYQNTIKINKTKQLLNIVEPNGMNVSTPTVTKTSTEAQVAKITCNLQPK
jgi:hypothetical protein